MKKAFDQTVRDIKRGVNKKVLKVPGIEQKVLDATSNEPWGPHGTLLAEVASASRNYHEYQMIVGIIWKRLNDTGKNWRHVYKSLLLLEYLVANGSERIIDEIKEHSYQISTLSGFQYIDSSGRDQGNNVRRKSQALVVLVNDKERITEVRQKAAANRDKFRSTSGGMYKPGAYDDDGRYGGRDEDRNGYGREREYNYRDDDRNGDPYGRDYEERNGRDGYRDDDYRGRNRSIDGYGSRSRSSDRDRDRSFDDDAQSSSRGSGARADDQYRDGRVGRALERKFSEQNIGGPPSYEEAVSESQSPAYNERETSETAPSGSSPPVPRTSPPAPGASSPPARGSPGPASTDFGTHESPAGQEVEVADEFDPRCPVSVAPTATAAPTSSALPAASNSAEVDLLGSLSDVFAPNPLAMVPISSAVTSPEADAQGKSTGYTSSGVHSDSNVMDQPFGDPFGDSPFRAIPSADIISDQQATPGSAASFLTTMNQNAEIPHGAPPTAESMNPYDFGDTFSGTAYAAPNVHPPSVNSQPFTQELSNLQPETDILADILPPSGPSPPASHGGFTSPTTLPAHPGAVAYGSFNSLPGNVAPVASHMGLQAPQGGSGNFLPQAHNNGYMLPQQYSAPGFSQSNHVGSGPMPQLNNTNFLPPQGSTHQVHPGFSQINHTGSGPVPQLNNTNYGPAQGSTSPAAQHNSDVLGDLFSQGPKAPSTSSTQLAPPSSADSLALVPLPSKDRFETKSTVWTDTLNRGLVNLNISGAKINPLSDIGIDFDAINRKEKRMEKPTTAAVTSTVTMGKAMGSGSGIGRTGAGALRPSSNPMMGGPGMGMGVGMMGPGMGMSGVPGSGMGMGSVPGSGMGMSGVPGSGMGMGGYGGMNQPMGMGMGMNMGMGANMGMNMGMGMAMNIGMGANMGMGQGGQMPLRTTMPGGYNPMMGTGGYPPQQPYGGGYR